MKLSSRSDYAAKAMLELSMTPNKPVNLAYLAQVENISLSYLEQIFALLRKHNLVKSVRGPGGGYILGRSLNEISIGDIVKAIDLDKPSTKNTDTNTMDHRPASHAMWAQLSYIVHDYLNQITLADMHNASKTDEQTVSDSEHAAA